jgi:hypothetical protein
MKLSRDFFKEGVYIPGQFAFCEVDPAMHVRLLSGEDSAA